MPDIKKTLTNLIGDRIGDSRIFPIATKIVLIFVFLILLSNFSSHYISLMLYRGEMIMMMKQHLVKDLRDIYTFAKTQHEISLAGTPAGLPEDHRGQGGPRVQEQELDPHRHTEERKRAPTGLRGRRYAEFPDREALALFNKNLSRRSRRVSPPSPWKGRPISACTSTTSTGTPSSCGRRSSTSSSPIRGGSSPWCPR